MPRMETRSSCAPNCRVAMGCTGLVGAKFTPHGVSSRCGAHFACDSPGGKPMKRFNLKPQTFGFLVGTRAALAFGLGLLAASRLPEGRRKRIGMALLGIGAATTVPAIR